MNQEPKHNLSDEIHDFLIAVSLLQPYRMIHCDEDPFLAEIRLLEALMHHSPLNASDVANVRASLTFSDAYFFVNFARRMAVQAVRTKNPAMLRTSILGIAFDQDFVDPKDILIDLSIIEDCANRLGLNLKDIAGEALDLATEKRRKTITDYCERPSEMRGLQIMRVAALGSDQTLTYERLPWG